MQPVVVQTGDQKWSLALPPFLAYEMVSETSSQILQGCKVTESQSLSTLFSARHNKSSLLSSCRVHQACTSSCSPPGLLPSPSVSDQEVMAEGKAASFCLHHQLAFSLVLTTALGSHYQGAWGGAGHWSLTGSYELVLSPYSSGPLRARP